MSHLIERNFQAEVLRDMQANGWLLGVSVNYDRALGLYSQDLLDFVQATQPAQWQKFCALYPADPEAALLARVAGQLNKADANASSVDLRSFGTLGVLRQELRDRGARFSLCQFAPEHGLNSETLARYQANRLRVVPELVYSPWASATQLAETGDKAKAWRIDLVLFVNGIPVVTMELKSAFKQAVESAMQQYRSTRLPIDPLVKKPEPLLSFKRGALVHFAVSQFEVYMATHLQGAATQFLPFNKGTADQAAGNDVPEDASQYATGYLWNEVLLPGNFLKILAQYVHLNIEEKEDAEGKKYKQESLIFPRYHQWDVVGKLLAAVRCEGAGHKYLIQHSAGSGKSNSIAWAAHQLSALHDAGGNKLFQSVLVVTDRTLLDDQLKGTIGQFARTEGLVSHIGHAEGAGSKSEKLAKALQSGHSIIIVTIQTFIHVLDAIESSAALSARNFAVIADEAHSSQTGSTAGALKQVLLQDGQAKDAPEPSAEDLLMAAIAARRASKTLSYLAFTATPKPKTMELFGRLPNPLAAPSKTNAPAPFHVYSMRQAIEEGFILDVLKNYTNYKVAYNLAMRIHSGHDLEVQSKRAKVKLKQWVSLHDHNIGQKVQVIIEHFKKHVMHLLRGQAKAMLVTSSRKAAVRYKLEFDKYIQVQGYTGIRAMVAFSGEVEFNADDPNAALISERKFTEAGMNPQLKGRDMRTAFDSGDYQVMIVANKFQTGFDQPKLCAMYVDKKLGGVECVQTLSRLNRIYPGKADTSTFILDFYNQPDEILHAFRLYYKTAELADVSNPNLIFDLQEKLTAAAIYRWTEVQQFAAAYFVKSETDATLANICKPGCDRWLERYKEGNKARKQALLIVERSKQSGDPVLIANALANLQDADKAIDALAIFKKDLGTFVRFYEFMSQIVDYDDKDLEMLSLYARNLLPLLRESLIESDAIDLSSIALSHFRLSADRQQALALREPTEELYQLTPGSELGSAKAKDQKTEFLAQIVERLNAVFEADQLTERDMVNYAQTISDKVAENPKVMRQLQANSPEQAMLGDFETALLGAIISSGSAHQNQSHQLISDKPKFKLFSRVVFDILSQTGQRTGL